MEPCAEGKGNFEMSLSISSGFGWKCLWRLKKRKKKEKLQCFFSCQWTPAVCGECPRGARQPTEIMGSPGVPTDTRTKNYSQSLPTDQVHNKENHLARSDKKI